MTLEQSRENLNQQMESMGMNPDKVRDTVSVLDLGIIRKSLTQLSAKGSWMQVFKMYAENLKASLGYEILVLDSLGFPDSPVVTRLRIAGPVPAKLYNTVTKKSECLAPSLLEICPPLFLSMTWRTLSQQALILKVGSSLKMSASRERLREKHLHL